MANVNSLKDGYVNETGVMSAAPTASGTVLKTTSAMIRHCVLIPDGYTYACSSIQFTSGYSLYLGSGVGQIGICGKGRVMHGKATAIRMISVASVIQPTAGRSGTSIPAGKLG